jgi:hypothetical protein
MTQCNRPGAKCICVTHRFKVLADGRGIFQEFLTSSCAEIDFDRRQRDLLMSSSLQCVLVFWLVISLICWAVKRVERSSRIPFAFLCALMLAVAEKSSTSVFSVGISYFCCSVMPLSHFYHASTTWWQFSEPFLFTFLWKGLFTFQKVHFRNTGMSMG